MSDHIEEMSEFLKVDGESTTIINAICLTLDNLVHGKRWYEGPDQAALEVIRTRAELLRSLAASVAEKRSVIT